MKKKLKPRGRMLFLSEKRRAEGFPLTDSGEQTQKTPIILVHGMGAWGEGSPTEEFRPYWGETCNIIPMLREKGYPVYNPTVGSFTSAWDRACDLFAVLTGTRADYGEAHSKLHGHKRYGRDYSDMPLMGTPWDMKTKLHLIGHSFGGVTVRLFTHLLIFGDETERKASGNKCSHLFLGGHTGLIHSITTLAAPHNGSQIANLAKGTFFPNWFFALASNISGAMSGKIPYDFVMDQWDFTVQPDTGRRAKLHIVNQARYAAGKDSCVYDLTLQGARRLNQKISIQKDIFYLSFTARITETNSKGKEKYDRRDIYPFFKMSCPILNRSNGFYAGGIRITKEWISSDGIVPLCSGLRPFTEPYIKYADAKTIKPGIWNVMPTFENTDHFDFCRTTGDPETNGYLDFFIGLFELLDETTQYKTV